MEKDIDVLFYGSWSPWREEVLFAAHKATKNIALYGNDWQKSVSFFQKRIYSAFCVAGILLDPI
jgi:DICT domain-containing protein